MTNEEIDKEIERLEKLKFYNSAKTKDGFPIEIGKIYYVLRNLSTGFEEVTINEDFSCSINSYCRYDQLFASKSAAKNYMKSLLQERIENSQNTIKNSEISLELLEKLDLTN